MLTEAKNYMISRLPWVLFQTLRPLSRAIASQLGWGSQSLFNARSLPPEDWRLAAASHLPAPTPRSTPYAFLLHSELSMWLMCLSESSPEEITM